MTPLPVPAAHGTSETILVVEDEDAVRHLATVLLSRLGYTVVSASSAEAALTEAAALGRSIDLLLTDIVLPGMNGPALAEQLRTRQSGLRVLFTSGYSRSVAARRFGLTDHNLGFISKPYDHADLARAVRRVLDAPAATDPIAHDRVDGEGQ
jgi:CheY-like chemotaxis protein